MEKEPYNELNQSLQFEWKDLNETQSDLNGT